MVGTQAKTALLFAAIIGLFVAIGGVVGYLVFQSLFAGLIVAFGFALVLNLVSYFGCDRFVLWSTGAKLVTDEEAPRLAKIVRELAPQFGLVAPRLAIIPTQTPNAFATGRDPRHAVVAATEGILRMLDDRELRAVLAHELAHVKDRDILVMTFAATLAGAISFAAQTVIFSQMFGGGTSNRNVNPIVLLIAAATAPIAAMLIQLAISRSRELRADEVGARTIGDPNALADALVKVENANEARPMAIGSPAAASLFIVNPLRRSSFITLFSTHPDPEVRIRRLRAMVPDFRYRPAVRPVRSVGAGRPGSA